MFITKILASLGLAMLGGGAPSNVSAPDTQPVVVPQAIVQEAEGQQTNNTSSDSENRVEEKIPEDVIETKQEVEKEEIPFKQKKETDSSLLRGETKTKQEGRVGIREKTYTITFTNGEETNRELTSNEVTQAPVDEIVVEGTKSPVVTPPKTSGKGYINVDGDFVKSPGSDPSGASARCKDGTYSYSKNRRGTCSGHGGVASWL